MQRSDQCERTLGQRARDVGDLIGKAPRGEAGKLRCRVWIGATGLD
jgi:hypothetical protein